MVLQQAVQPQQFVRHRIGDEDDGLVIVIHGPHPVTFQTAS
jgi:hypothetical protein